jgi:hypothetical protein
MRVFPHGRAAVARVRILRFCSTARTAQFGTALCIFAVSQLREQIHRGIRPGKTSRSPVSPDVVATQSYSTRQAFHFYSGKFAPIDRQSKSQELQLLLVLEQESHRDSAQPRGIGTLHFRSWLQSLEFVPFRTRPTIQAAGTKSQFTPWYVPPRQPFLAIR